MLALRTNVAPVYLFSRVRDAAANIFGAGFVKQLRERNARNLVPKPHVQRGHGAEYFGYRDHVGAAVIEPIFPQRFHGLEGAPVESLGANFGYQGATLDDSIRGYFHVVFEKTTSGGFVPDDAGRQD